MKLTSPAFSEGGNIPSKYTCEGEEVSPPLSISDIPADAKSLVLIMDDPDIPDFVRKRFGIEVWGHWIVFNIPASVCEIAEGKNPEGILGKNASGELAYGGPCPPDREHHYFFNLYALDCMLALQAGVSKKEVEQAMQGHLLAQTELMGRYVMSSA